jgi:hypothetical protein
MRAHPEVCCGGPVDEDSVVTHPLLVHLLQTPKLTKQFQREVHNMNISHVNNAALVSKGQQYAAHMVGFVRIIAPVITQQPMLEHLTIVVQQKDQRLAAWHSTPHRANMISAILLLAGPCIKTPTFKTRHLCIVRPHLQSRRCALPQAMHQPEAHGGPRMA